MRALTLTQPWATLMAIGAKKNETRSWWTAYSGPVAIHASKNFPKECKALCNTPVFQSALMSVGDWQLGKIIAVGVLVDTPRVDMIRDSLSWEEKQFGDYSGDRHAWVFRDITPLPEPIPAKGKQGLWRPDEATYQEIIKQLFRNQKSFQAIFGRKKEAA